MSIYCPDVTSPVCVCVCVVPIQDHLHHHGALHGALPAVRWLLLLQRDAAGAAGAARLLGLPHPAHGLQVHLPGQGQDNQQ